MPSEENIPTPPLVEAPEVTYDTFTVKLDSIENNVTVTGTFTTIKQSNVFFASAEGRIAEINVIVGDKVEEGDTLISLQTVNIDYNIKQQEFGVEKAQLNHDKAEKAYDAGTISAADLRSAEIDLESAKLQLEYLKEERERSILYAPMSGDVTFMSSDIGPGRYVSPYQVLLIISDPKTLQLQYSGSNYTYFTSGMLVEVEYDGMDYVGEVVSTPADAPADSLDSVQSTVRINVADLPADTKRGETATIKRVLERAEDVIVIPKQAIRNYSGRKYVQILEDGVKKERDVKTGIETTTRAEITEGLEVGDEVILD